MSPRERLTFGLPLPLRPLPLPLSGSEAVEAVDPAGDRALFLDPDLSLQDGERLRSMEAKDERDPTGDTDPSATPTSDPTASTAAAGEISWDSPTTKLPNAAEGEGKEDTATTET
jgi:hypothetical protein